MLGAALLAIPPLFCLVYFYEYRMQRVLAFLDPLSDPLGSGFQILQSWTAVGSGGLTGLGLMAGKQKLFYLPEPHTDFIYAVIGEEWGLVGSLAVLGLFGVFLWRGVRLSLRAGDGFGRFLGLGLTAMVVCQAFVNISVVLSLLPTKGIPLPFVSSGRLLVAGQPGKCRRSAQYLPALRLRGQPQAAEGPDRSNRGSMREPSGLGGKDAEDGIFFIAQPATG